MRKDLLPLLGILGIIIGPILIMALSKKQSNSMQNNSTVSKAIKPCYVCNGTPKF